MTCFVLIGLVGLQKGDFTGPFARTDPKHVETPEGPCSHPETVHLTSPHHLLLRLHPGLPVLDGSLESFFDCGRLVRLFQVFEEHLDFATKPLVNTMALKFLV